MFDFIYNTQICSDLISQAPVSLILYTHIPSMVITMLIGIFVLINNRTLLGKILFFITVFFSFWAAIDLVAWLSTNSIFTMFMWSLFWMTSGLISILSFYFFHVFILSRDFGLTKKIFLFAPLLPFIFFTPTKWAVTSFDLINCEARDGTIFAIYYYVLAALAVLGILLLIIINWKKINKDFRKEVLLMATGLELFLISFYSLSAISNYLDNYNIEFYGLFGMVIFMAFLSYLIVKFKAFDIKLIGSQALVWALVILIGSQFFFIQTNINRVLTAITLVLAAIMGLIIVRSVKKEIVQREELAIANENQQLLIRFITHQVKGFFTKSKMVFASILEGDVGEAPAPMIELVKTGMDSDNKAVEMVQEVLKASSLRSGQMNFTFEETNMNNFIKDLAEGFKDIAVQKGLQYEVNLPTEAVSSKIDKLQLTQVIKNLIDNSVKYTLSGFVKVNLKKTGGNLLFTVHDSGVGLSDSDKAKLFKEGGRGDESLKVNVNSTGYGLFIVKKIVEGHGGKIWAESVGRGHGSTFCVELPLIK